MPTPAEALAEPFRAFPSWFLRITCDRCGKVQVINERHARWRHDGCGGLTAKVELLTRCELGKRPAMLTRPSPYGRLSGRWQRGTRKPHQGASRSFPQFLNQVGTLAARGAITELRVLWWAVRHAIVGKAYS